MTEQSYEDIRKMKIFATSLLGGMVLVFIASSVYLHAYPWLAPVVAFSEAAMIGAMADWFAVVALFRHPLGIPIPHTAIVPHNKERIAANLGDFIEKNFLSNEGLGRTQSRTLARGIIRWLNDPRNTHELAHRISTLFPRIAPLLREPELGAAIERAVEQGISGVRAAPFLADTLEILIASERHELIAQEVLAALNDILAQNEIYIQDKLNQFAPWFIPNFVTGRLAETIVSRLQKLLSEVESTPDHELRGRFEVWLTSLKEKLRNDPAYQEKAESMKTALLESQLVNRYARNVWNNLIDKFSESPADPSYSLELPLQQMLSKLGQTLSSEPRYEERLAEFLAQTLSSLFAPEPGSFAAMITETVKQWETNTLVEKLELQVGKDLQYIRVNGTLVGGMIGLLIHFASLAFLS